MEIRGHSFYVSRISSNGTNDISAVPNSRATYIMVTLIGSMILMSACLLVIAAFLRSRIFLIEAIVPGGRRDDNHPVNRSGEGGTRGIDAATLDSYPKMLYSEEGLRSSKSVEEDQSEAQDKGCCSICLSDYSESELVRVMPDCGHMFHAVCIDEWLCRHATCPVCRTSPHLLAPLAIVSQP